VPIILPGSETSNTTGTEADGFSPRETITERQMATRQQVAQFLRDFKAALTLGHVRWLRRSDQTKAHLSGLEVTRNQAADCLLGLTPDNYSKGPEADDSDPRRDVWFFGCCVEGTEAYVKLALEPDKRRRTVVHAVIWSFHAAAYPVKYPLRESS